MITIQNDSLQLLVSTHGAEMKSLKDTFTGQEYLWQGDPQYWSGTSPILFPCVGGLWNGVYRHRGRTWELPRHGFVRHREWTVVETAPSSVTLTYTLHGDDLRYYPFLSRVGVTYRLEQRKVITEFTVENLGNVTMHFQLGGHPAIQLPDFDLNEPVSGFISLENTAHSLLRAAEQGCTQADRHPIPRLKNGHIPLCQDTFAHEALIFDQNQLRAATLLRRDGHRLARLESEAPVWLFWSPQNRPVPFVCIEPWYGLCDPIGFEGTLEQRPYINRLAGGECWHGGYTLEVF